MHIRRYAIRHFSNVRLRFVWLFKAVIIYPTFVPPLINYFHITLELIQLLVYHKSRRWLNRLGERAAI